MRTNKEKWDYYMSIIKQKEDDYLKTIKNVPDKIFDVYPGNGVGMHEYNVTGIFYSYDKKDEIYKFYWGKKPTREDVRKIAESSTKEVDFKFENVRISYRHVNNKNKWDNGSRTFAELEKYEALHTNREDAERYIIFLREKQNKEKELLSNGHIRCSYCSKIVPKVNSVNYTIIARQYKNMEQINGYCSMDCAVSDQMAHEG